MAQESNVPNQTNATRDAAEPGPTNELSSGGDLVQTNELSASNELTSAEEAVSQTNVAKPTNALVQVTATPNGNRDVRPREETKQLEPRQERVATTKASSALERASGDASTSARNSAAKPDFSSFRMIAERNIFDPNRFPRRRNGPAVPQKTMESFALVGIMSYEKGTFAFFDGSSAAYKKALKQADTIAGYKLTNVTPELVTLAAGTNQMELRVGSQLRREEEGGWTLAKVTDTSSYSATPANTSTPAATSSGSGSTASDNDVLERLRKKREQE